MPIPTRDEIVAALARVNDPELHRPITDLDMVGQIDIAADGGVTLELLLTMAACPLKDKLRHDAQAALEAIAGIGPVTVNLGVMNAAQLQDLKTKLRGGPEPEIPFTKPGAKTRIFAVASGKGGVGKSSVTVNLAAALAADGLSVGLVDADIYGFSVPRMLGATDEVGQLEEMLLPVTAHGVKAISIGQLVEPGQPVIWRGPMLHRALQQFLTDVYWGDLDVLLLDLPPGTGDVAISVAQLLPGSEILVVTTPQVAAAEVAQRAGALALQARQRIAGVIENMSWLTQPDGSRLELFGAGGGQQVADNLSQAIGAQVPLLGQIPIDIKLRQAADGGQVIVLSDPDSPAALALRQIAAELARRVRTMAGRSLGIAPL